MVQCWCSYLYIQGTRKKRAIHTSASYLLHLDMTAVLLFFFTVILCGSVKVTWNGIYFKVSFWTLGLLSFTPGILNKRPGTDLAELAVYTFNSVFGNMHALQFPVSHFSVAVSCDTV